MDARVPAGWPAEVRPPGSDDFQATAIAWLLDVLPPDFRQHPVLRRYPAALAHLARHHACGSAEGARQGYRTARTELADIIPPHAVDAVLAVYRAEGSRLAAVARGTELVGRALRSQAPASARGAQ